MTDSNKSVCLWSSFLIFFPSRYQLYVLICAEKRERRRGWEAGSCCRPYTVKKVYRFSRPQPGCHLQNSPWTEIFKLFPSRQSLVHDTPAGDGKMANLFFTVYWLRCQWFLMLTFQVQALLQQS
jgi:hypothetical protein